MMTLIELIIITSFFILGIHYCFQFDMVSTTKKGEAKPTNKEILWFIKYYLHRSLYQTRFEWLLKPTVNCPVCMSSIHGSILFWANVYFQNREVNPLTFAKWLVVVVAVAGLNRLAYKFLIS